MLAHQAIEQSLWRTHTTVCRIELHRLKAVLFLQHRAGPLPQATHLALASELATILSDGHGVPVLEAYVRLIEVREDFGWIQTSCGAGGSVMGRVGCWRLLDAVVHEMTANGQRKELIGRLLR